MRILFICPGGQNYLESPSEHLAKEVQERSGWEVSIWNKSFHKGNPFEDIHKFDLIWGDMDGKDVCSTAVSLAQDFGKKSYIHGEWVPPYRVQEGWSEYFNTPTQLAHKKRYMKNLEAMGRADLVSLALKSTPGGFDWIEETFGISFDNYFVRYPACEEYPLCRKERKYQVATIARADDPKKRVGMTVQALEMLDDPPSFTLLGGKKSSPKIEVKSLGAWNGPEKVEIFSESLLAIQHWSGIPPAEAIQQMCPVIGFDFPYMRELYVDAMDWVPLNGGVEALSECIRKWLCKTQTERDEYARGVRERFLSGSLGVKPQRYRADLVIEKIKELF